MTPQQAHRRLQQLRIGVGAIAVAIVVAALMSPSRDNEIRAEIRADAIKEHPKLAAVLTDNEMRNRCIVEMATRLSGFRDDYVWAAGRACQAADYLKERGL